MKDFDYKFYAVNKKSELVYGFDNREEATEYSHKHGFFCVPKKNLIVDPSSIDNWSNDYPEPNVD